MGESAEKQMKVCQVVVHMSSPVVSCVDSPHQVRLWLVLSIVRANPEPGRLGVDSCEVRLQAGEQQRRSSAGGSQRSL